MREFLATAIASYTSHPCIHTFILIETVGGCAFFSGILSFCRSDWLSFSSVDVSGFSTIFFESIEVLLRYTVFWRNHFLNDGAP